jgi:phospholipid/cholesterol/gamma-HCH transport system substrate-binding protein
LARHANPVVKPLIKFGIYAAFCLVLLFVLAARVGNLTPPTTHRSMYHAVLSNADSLVTKDDVKIAGVTVGQVHGVKVQRGQAIVTFSVDSNIHLRAGTATGMRWENVIGAKFLYLYPSVDGAVVKPGGTFTNEVAGADVGNFLIDLGGFFKALNPNDVNAFTGAIVTALQGNQDQVSSLLDNTATVSKTLGGLDTNIGNIIDNLNGVLSALEARDGDLANVIDRLSSVSADLATRNDVIDNLIANFTTVNTDLSKLVDANDANVNDIATNLQTVTNVLVQHTSDLNRDLATAPAGFAPYIEISKLGQWFAIRVVYTCLLSEKTCTYEQPTNQPATLNNPIRPVAAALSPTPASILSPPPIGPALPAPSIGSILDFAVYGDGSGSAATPAGTSPGTPAP